MFKKYYCVKQHDMTDCGAACLAAVSKQYGFQVSITKIRESAGTDKQGTNIYGLIQAAEHLGFSARGVKGGRDAFFSEFPLPCIAHVILDGSLLHYVVIHKIDKKQVVIADPAKGIVKLPPEEFFGMDAPEGRAAAYRWSGTLLLLVPDQKFKKGNESKGLFGRFLFLLAPHKKLLLHVFTASWLVTLLGIAGSFYFKFLLDDILPAGIEKTLHIVSVLVVILGLFRVLLSAVRSQLMLHLSQKLDISLLLGYYHHVLKLPMHFFSTRRAGEILSRFQDASGVRDAISGAALTMMIDTFMAAAGGVILYLQNGRMFFMALLVLVLYGCIVAGFNRSYRKLNRKQMEANAELTSYMVESLNGIQAVKAHHAEEEASLKTEMKFIRLLKSVFRLQAAGNLQNSLVWFVELAGGIVILWTGAYYVIKGHMTIGQLITFHSLLAYFLDPVKNLINLQPQMQTAIVAADRLGEILDLAAERGEGEMRKLQPADLRGDIEWKDAAFRYGSRRAVLEDFCLRIKQGQKVAFVGESGCGKTTLAKLLLHFYPLEKGEILINGTNILDIQLDVLRGKIAYIPQETFFFTGTIFENLSFGLQDVTREEIIAAAVRVKAHDFINALPLRYETRLTENGMNLSGGQRQRLAIARALLQKPDILILDEATSCLDRITEQAVEETIDEYCKDMTTIIIAHRLNTVKRCDTIFVFEKGKVMEQGSHAQLLKLGGRYADMWEKQ